MIEIEWRSEPRREGTLVAFCGLDGSGKTTQVRRLQRRLEDAGLEVLVTKQPTAWYRDDAFVRTYLNEGGTPAQARSLALFAAADRLRHCSEVIVPALERGAWVLSDRYVFSSLVYFKMRGVPQAFVATINTGVLKPDVSLLLDVPPDLTLERLRSRDGDDLKFEERSLTKMIQVHQGFHELSGHFTVLDGAESSEAVAQAVWDAVRHLLPHHVPESGPPLAARHNGPRG